MPRDIDLTFDISTGALTLDRVVGNYVKRSETLTLSVTIVSNGASATIPSGLVGTLKPVNTYGTTLAQWTTFSQVGATNVYTASTTINAAAVTTLLGTTTEQANCVFDFAGAGVVESDTLALVLKNNVTRDDDTAPTALLNRNDFLVTNGTGLLVNVAAGYAANGAFVAAQASLAITNATNYIEVTAAGVASVNTTAFTAGSYPLATVVASAGAITANTDLRAWITPKPAAAGGVTSVTGTANEITVTGTTTPTLSLPSALTFTGKTVTGGTFSAPTLFEPLAKIYKILDNQDGTRQGHLTNDFKHVYLDSGGDVFLRWTDFISQYHTLAHFSASTGQMSLGMSAFLSGKIGFKNSTSIGTTTLASANVSATDYTATLPAATGTLLLSDGSGANLTTLNASNISSGTLADARLSANVPLKDAANTFTAENINSKSGAASVTAMKFTGVPFAGTGTTSFPLVYINDANATASTTLNTAGTYLGVNGDGTQDLMNLLKDGVSQFKVGSTGIVNTYRVTTTSSITATNDGFSTTGNGTGTWFGRIITVNGNEMGVNANVGILFTTPYINATGTLAVTGATTLTGNLTSNGALISTPQALTGAGAVNVTTLTTAVTTTAPAQALTLANGTNGQIKTIVHQALSGGGTWVLTPTTKTGYTTITSTAVGETCTLQFFTTIGWCILSLRGAIAA